MTRRSIHLIVFGLCSGSLLGTLVGDFIAFLLPDGSAVKQFFLLSYDFTFGSRLYSLSSKGLSLAFCSSNLAEKKEVLGQILIFVNLSIIL